MFRTNFRLVWAAIGPICCASIAFAQFASIRTNQGGADAELREFQTTLGTGTLSNIVVGTANGATTELATRAINSVTIDNTQNPPVISNPFPTTDRSSVGMVKFNISSLPPSTDTSFWTPHAKVQFRLYVRNNNSITTGRLFGPNPSDPTQEVNARFRFRALDPTKVYGDDNPAAFNRTDRTGNAYVATQNKYNWDENLVTFYNAPGITPHRIDATTGNLVETLGLYDDFNSDVIQLGTLTLRDFLPSGGTALPQGSPIIFEDDSLKNLIFAAQAANRTHITLMFHFDNDTNLHQPSVGINGVTPTNFLNFNYLFVPKELTTQVAGINNSNGDFSPELRVVPEPASLGWMLLGLSAAMARRRRS
ncbi:MAG: PEP-CTERM sorting domain-containing protein [Phycisphaerae bacterium]|nr:PEP-CTERM sorting domain-containing protein [Phycisphaerae bacterium]MDW8262264.1 PEP-CTERM sorting domain-containing protein [Phycisphaerales bacterium]